eukprot:CAMPEP_0206481718 /NCGR_PEP_ID=MMETSP0324_2-20121206/38337_1 /ASSEMBLY_ACC=CAM_ASM_000836 /TAXON_ID=2866 /ORGANISM="Crypthecodinium cohnii, Strain Seligo" /LENGTH=131 /DNA_ID=CAMNT_0053959311 /DNA_START=139 /DNA_END=531 /DNA_ORIENTATION=+
MARGPFVQVSERAIDEQITDLQAHKYTRIGGRREGREGREQCKRGKEKGKEFGSVIQKATPLRRDSNFRAWAKMLMVGRQGHLHSIDGGAGLRRQQAFVPFAGKGRALAIEFKKWKTTQECCSRQQHIARL